VATNLASKFSDMNVPLTNTTQFEYKFCPIKRSSVLPKLQSLNPWKAIGVDKISNRMLKAVAPVIARLLTKTFNHSLETGTFPSDY